MTVSFIRNRRTDSPIPDPSSPSLGSCPNCDGQVRTCFTESIEDYACENGCGFWISNLEIFFTAVPHISQSFMRRLLAEGPVVRDDLLTCEGKSYSAKVMLIQATRRNRWEIAIEAVAPSAESKEGEGQEHAGGSNGKR